MVTITHILCPTDFSEVSTKAEAYAIALAKRYEARLSLLHVDPPMPMMAPYGEIPVDIRLFEEQRRQAEQDLAAAGTRARDAGLGVDTALIGGYPGREILAVAREQDVDLIVLGSHGRGGVEHLLLGSVAEKVLRKAPCPVMVVPAAATPERGVLFGRILCPVDGSQASADAVAQAVDLARETDGQLTLLHVVEPMPEAGEFAALDVDEYRRAGEAYGARLMREAVSDTVREWCRIDERIVVGKPGDRILDTAKNMAADVIVMGVRGRGALDLLAFGSTANAVVRQAQCPVFVVHPKAGERRKKAAAPAVVLV
ncbi:MAG: universal stress protein [Vicinamibacterales bacterium]